MMPASGLRGKFWTAICGERGLRHAGDFARARARGRNNPLGNCSCSESELSSCLSMAVSYSGKVIATDHRAIRRPDARNKQLVRIIAITDSPCLDEGLKDCQRQSGVGGVNTFVETHG